MSDTTKKHKMVEAGEATGPEAEAARRRMVAAGYPVENCEMKKVAHPQPNRILTFLA